MFRLARPSYRILGVLLALLLLAQSGVMGAVQAAQPRWLEICSAAGTRYIPVDDAPSTLSGHDDRTHCPACPIGQLAALPAAPPAPVYRAAFAGTALPLPVPLLRAVPGWRPSLPRGPPLPA